jgi:hypothetical protein
VILGLLAEAVQADTPISGNWLLAMVPVLASALGVILGKNHWKKQGATEAQQIGPQPFIVKMTEEFVTRREFVELKTEIRTDVKEMRSLFERTMDKIEAQNTELSKSIEDGIKEGRMGRVAIWKELNPQGQKLERIAAQQDVAVQIGKLADAIVKHG